MVLIEVANSEGVVGRCDAKCYNAKEPGCTCVCGGRNHGAGLQRALENTREQAERWIEAYAESQGLREYTASVNERVYQMSIFDAIEEAERDRAIMLTQDTRHDYRPAWSRIEAYCRVRVFEHDGKTVAIVTEQPDNHGMSITNAAEWLLPEIAKQYKLPDGTIWIEHYPARRRQPESFDLVSLASGAPAWQRLALEQVEALTGAEL